MRIIFSVVVFVAVLFLGSSLYVSFIGKRDSAWLLVEMWQAPYFNAAKGGLAHEEVVNLMTLQPFIADEGSVTAYLSANKCEDATYACMLNTLSAANILVGAGEVELGLKLIEAARQKTEKKANCPISIESSILLYKLKMFSREEYLEAVSEATATVNKVRERGGLLYNLRTQECTILAKERPELFHEYVIMVSRAMTYAVGEYSAAGAFIQESNKLNY